VLSVDSVAFGYDERTPVLADIGFTVAPGDVVAIVGRNGAGKSTLLRLLNGLLQPRSGRIVIDGCATADTPVHVLARHIGTVFQAPEQQMFHANVWDEIAFGARQLGLTGDALEERVHETLVRTGLEDVTHVHPLDLDQARRRFVALASVLAMRPPILLLDEPQRGLDRAAVERLESIVAEQAAAGRSVLLVCHDMDFVARRATRVIAVARGRIVADHPTLDFFGDPALAHAAGVELPDTIALARALDLPPALTPPAFAAAWMESAAS
jgi:energy-coupling factor transport system ATP-binding protein